MSLNFKVMLLTDWGQPNLLDFLEPLLVPGVAIQQRHHHISDREFFEESKTLSERCKAKDVPLFINGHLDVALALHCHLHISSYGLPFDAVKHLVKRNMLVSTSIHSLDDVAKTNGTHLAIAAPVFSPKSKPNDLRVPLGAAGFSELKSALTIPVFAMGGIDESSPRQLPQSDGFALLKSLYSHQNPLQLIQYLLSGTKHP